MVIPIILTVMGFAYGSGSSEETPKIPVGIAADDHSDFVRELIERIKDTSIKAIEMNRQRLLKELRNQTGSRFYNS